MKSITDILREYTNGEATLEETNAALKEAGANVHLNPGKNKLTEEELAVTHAGDTPEETGGFGLLDTGTGSLDKVRVVDGKLMDCDCGEMIAFVLIGGKTYRVQGDTLVK